MPELHRFDGSLAGVMAEIFRSGARAGVPITLGILLAAGLTAGEVRDHLAEAVDRAAEAAVADALFPEAA